MLEGLKGANPDQEAGIAIIRRALEAPMRQIAENAGVDGAVVAGKVREVERQGLWLQRPDRRIWRHVQFGVIDPAKVVRTALEDAASVAGLLITTEAMVAEKARAESRRRHARHGRHGRHGRDDVIIRLWRKCEGRPERDGLLLRQMITSRVSRFQTREVHLLVRPTK